MYALYLEKPVPLWQHAAWNQLTPKQTAFAYHGDEPWVTYHILVPDDIDKVCPFTVTLKLLETVLLPLFEIKLFIKFWNVEGEYVPAGIS